MFRGPLRCVFTAALILTSVSRVHVRLFSSGARDVSNLSKLPRLHLDFDLKVGETVRLEGSEAHYISKVMRVKPGFCFRVFNAREDQGEYLMEVIEKSSRRDGTISTVVKSKLRNFDATLLESIPATLYFAPVRKHRLKLMIEKATELGLSRLVPVISQNVNANIDFSKDESYTRIITESIEQCERLDMPSLRTDPFEVINIAGETSGQTIIGVQRAM